MEIGRIAKIETFGTLDGPGIRTVIFLQGCSLRCAYCHNPSMLSNRGGKQYTTDEIIENLLNYKAYYGKTGGVTVSGGEPLLQIAFLIELFKKCQQHRIHTCLDTAGVSSANDKQIAELLSLTDLVMLDIKHTTGEGYKEITLVDIKHSEKFIELLNKSRRPVWVRQVIIPKITDNVIYIYQLANYLKNIKNIKKVEFLPYHTMAVENYKKLGLPYRYEGVPAMSEKKCKKLYLAFLKIYNAN